jgi:Protein involved in formate dehydrogenase formation
VSKASEAGGAQSGLKPTGGAGRGGDAQAAPDAKAGLVVQAFEEHARRCGLLSEERPAVRAPLLFAGGLYRAMGAVAQALVRAHAEAALTGALERDAARVNLLLGPLWETALAGPAPLAEAARARAAEEPSLAAGRLVTTLSQGGGDDLLSRAALRSWLSALAVLGLRPAAAGGEAAGAGGAGAEAGAPGEIKRRALPVLDSVGGSVVVAHGGAIAEGGRCGFCGGHPAVASRRTLPESDGASRFLHCALCGGEWRVNRIRCPWCGEEDPQKLPHFEAAQAAGARIEGCETCGRYLKSIDRSTDMRRVPEVDDLATLALDLWAAEQGLARGEAGLLG